MPICFVIQPFDKGAFDKRYEDIVGPAIEAAGLEPYRVDQDPYASIPIEQIESGIRRAAVCVADITVDNPNVWFELGFSIAIGTPVILVSAASRQRFPFDVQHRNVITYATDSPSDFTALRDKITKRLKAVLSDQAQLDRAAQVESSVAPVEGLATHELVTIVAVAQNLESPNDSVSTYIVRKDMERAGFTRIAVTLALASLIKKGLLSLLEAYDEHNGPYAAYSLTADGFLWLQTNQERLALKSPPQEDVPF